MLFTVPDDSVAENFINSIAKDHFQIVGTELILGKIYQKMVFQTVGAPTILRVLFFPDWFVPVSN